MDDLVVTAEVLGTPAPGLAVWRAQEDPDVAGDLEEAPDQICAGDVLILRVQRSGFRWVVRELLDHLPDPSRARTAPARRRRPHAHPATPPGTVVVAWLPFTAEETDPDDPQPTDVAGKHRPVVVLRSTDPDVLRVRPLFDVSSATARRTRGPRLEQWWAAGLDKASVAGPPVEVPVARRDRTLGTLTAVDRAALGIRP